MTKTRFGSVAFAVAVLCFFLPFVSVSCQGQNYMSFTGVQAAIGTTVTEPQMFGPPQQKQVPGDKAALGALVAAVVGLLVSLRAPRLSGLLAAGGAALLLLFKSRMEANVLTQGEGVLTTKFETGFWCALGCFAAAAIIAVMTKPPAVHDSAGAPPLSERVHAGDS